MIRVFTVSIACLVGLAPSVLAQTACTAANHACKIGTAAGTCRWSTASKSLQCLANPACMTANEMCVMPDGATVGTCQPPTTATSTTGAFSCVASKLTCPTGQRLCPGNPGTATMAMTAPHCAPNAFCPVQCDWRTQTHCPVSHMSVGGQWSSSCLLSFALRAHPPDPLTSLRLCPVLSCPVLFPLCRPLQTPGRVGPYWCDAPPDHGRQLRSDHDRLQVHGEAIEVPHPQARGDGRHGCCDG